MANKEKYAVLLEDYSKEEAMVATMTRQNAKEEFGQVERDLTKPKTAGRPPSNRLESAPKRKKGRCQRLPHCITCWPLLLAVSTTFIALVTFHLWFTWHLHRKVEALHSRVESLSTLELDEMRSQLGYLYHLCDDTTITEKIDLANVNQEVEQAEDKLVVDFGHDDDVEKAAERNIPDGFQEDDGTEKDLRLFSSKQSLLEPSREIEVDDDDHVREERESTTRTKRILISGHEMKVDGRRKRQADLSSHTQDGVPIFERGYGVTLNRTEGLRIYQSLLANGAGRSEVRTTDNIQSQDVPLQTHHRPANNYWRGKKDKPRHRHQLKPTTTPFSDDVELSSAQEGDATNDQDFRSFITTSSPSRNGGSSNVEFRHSRVKTSPEASHVPQSIQGDQKPWTTSRNNGMSGVVPMGALSHSSSSQEDRISAATAPAILTKTVTASIGPSASNRVRQQPNVFKVTQPALISRSSSQADNAEESVSSRDSHPSSSPTSRKKINKKQLRDLSHTATAVHLVAETRNVSSANLENQVEIASRNELGLHTSWKIASNDWDSPLKTTPLVKIDGAILTVKQSGLYFIYAQVHYLDDHSTNAYEVFINTEPFLRCVTSAFSDTSFPKANTCYTAAAAHLREGDKIFLRDIEPLRYSVLQPSKTFLGLIRMAPIADFS